jgi:hypothetical protein
MPVPPTQFERTVTDPAGKMLPTAVAFAGFKIELLAKRTILKVLKAAEELMTTATLSCWGIMPVELIRGAAKGQLVLPSLAMHTFPMKSE